MRPRLAPPLTARAIALSAAGAALAQPCATGPAPGLHIRSLNDSALRTIAWDDGSGPALFVAGRFGAAGRTLGALSAAKWDGQRWLGMGGGISMSSDAITTPGSVEALQIFDSGFGPALFAAGSFFWCANQPASCIARWDGIRWTPLPPAVQFVHALTVFDDGSGSGPALYVGGEFSNILGAPSPGVAKWTGFAWLPAPAALPIPIGQLFTFGGVRDLAVFDDGSGAGPRLYAVVFVHNSSSADSSRLYRLGPAGWEKVPGAPSLTNASGFSLTAVNAGPARGLYTYKNVFLRRFDGASWADLPPGAGPNEAIAACAVEGPAPRLAIVRRAFDPTVAQVELWDGAAWSPLGPAFPFSWSPTSLRVTQANNALDATMTVLEFGDFTTSAVLRLTPEGWTPLEEPDGIGLFHTVRSLSLFDDGSGRRLFALGALGSRASAGALRLDDDHWTNLPTDPAQPASGLYDPNSLVPLPTPDGPRLFALGALTLPPDPSYGPTHLAAQWNGSAWTPLAAGPGRARAAAMFDPGAGAALYIAGDFASVDGVPARNIAQRTPAGWAPLGAGTNLATADLAVFDDGAGAALYLGGSFSLAAGVQALGLARWDGQSVSAIPGFSGVVSQLAVGRVDGHPNLFVAGSHLRVGERSLGAVARFDGVAWRTLGVNSGNAPAVLEIFGDGPTQSVVLAANAVQLGGIDLGPAAAYDGRHWSSLAIDADGPITSAAIDEPDEHGGATLWLGGAFSRIGPLASANIARIAYCSLHCPADISGDRRVDFIDLNFLLDQYGAAAPAPEILLPADLNADGVVDFIDLNILLSSFGLAC